MTAFNAGSSVTGAGLVTTGANGLGNVGCRQRLVSKIPAPDNEHGIGELRRRLDPQFARDIRAMDIHRAPGDSQMASNLFGCEALAKEIEDLALSRREAIDASADDFFFLTF